jgi:outer membrane immunogenic protein
MHKLLLTALLSTVAIPALAADLPGKAPRQPPVVVTDWTGFYIGIHGGYGWGKTSVDNIDLNRSFEFNGFFENPAFTEPKLKGWVFGGHAGYNWQLGQRWVGGLEIDYSASDIKEGQSVSAADDGTIVTRTLDTKLDRLATVRARLGVLIVPDLLLYGTAGAAWGRTKVTNIEDWDFGNEHHHTYTSQSNTNHFGWVAGVGGEWRLTGNLFLRAEYLHYDFGNTTHAFNVKETDLTHCSIPCLWGPANVDAKLTTDVVRGGLSLKF